MRQRVFGVYFRVHVKFHEFRLEKVVPHMADWSRSRVIETILSEHLQNILRVAYGEPENLLLKM